MIRAMARILPVWLLSGLVVAQQPESAAGATVARRSPSWRRTVVDAQFRSEAVAAADVDRDGDIDLLVGDLWYEAPTWGPHPIRAHRDLGDGARNWSECFANAAFDVDRDGYVDQVAVGFPGKPARWYRNPGAEVGKSERWAAHVIVASACNESPQLVDLFADGKPVLLLGTQPEGEMCWLQPGAQPTQPWERHALSAPQAPGTGQFAHGLGIGDVDGDGRRDVLVTDGYWRQPEGGRAAGVWTFVPAALGPACAHMYAADLDRDGLQDVVSSSAHARGVWWHRQARGDGGAVTFERQDILTTITQTHALVLADIDDDGDDDLVTGKRWWAHGPDGDEDPNGTPLLVWIEVTPGSPPRFQARVIDDASGVGTGFVVADLDGDGDRDVAVANKKGVFVFTQERLR